MVFLWGFTAIIGKLITVGALPLVFLRMSFSAVILFLFIRFVRKQSLSVARPLGLRLLGVGFVIAIHWLCFFHSIKISNVSIALSCLSLSTLFAALMEPLFFRRRIDWLEVAIGLVIVGCVAMIFQVEFQFKEGIFFGILAAFFGTLFSVFNGKLFGRTSSENIMFYELSGGALLIFAGLLATGEVSALPAVSFKDYLWILLLAGVFTAYPMLESVKLMKHISPFTLILTINLEPVYGIVFAFFIFGDSEKMSWLFYLASLMMILAIVANGLIKSRREKRKLTAENTPIL